MIREKQLILSRLSKSESFKEILHHAKGQIELIAANESGFAHTVCLVELAEALDEDQIHFDDEKARTMFYSLLGMVLNQVFSGKFPASNEETMQ